MQTNLQTGRETIFEYDSLVIATGARALVPNIKGVNQFEGVFLIRNYGDGVRINDSTKNARSCLIAGAGLIGLEMAEAFKKRYTTRTVMDVTVVEMSDHILPLSLTPNMAKIIRELEANGVKVILGEQVEEILGSGIERQVKGVKTTTTTTTNTNTIATKRQIDADFVVLGTGVRPNSEIAKRCWYRARICQCY